LTCVNPWSAGDEAVHASAPREITLPSFVTHNLDLARRCHAIIEVVDGRS
jgi:hypothetical protein